MSEKKVWVLIEWFGGLPEGLWVFRSEKAAKKFAKEFAEEVDFSERDENFWVRGDTELYLREGVEVKE